MTELKDYAFVNMAPFLEQDPEWWDPDVKEHPKRWFLFSGDMSFTEDQEGQDQYPLRAERLAYLIETSAALYDPLYVAYRDVSVFDFPVSNCSPYDIGASKSAYNVPFPPYRSYDPSIDEFHWNEILLRSRQQDLHTSVILNSLFNTFVDDDTSVESLVDIGSRADFVTVSDAIEQTRGSSPSYDTTLDGATIGCANPLPLYKEVNWILAYLFQSLKYESGSQIGTTYEVFTSGLGSLEFHSRDDAVPPPFTELENRKKSKASNNSAPWASRASMMACESWAGVPAPEPEEGEEQQDPMFPLRCGRDYVPRTIIEWMDGVRFRVSVGPRTPVCVGTVERTFSHHVYEEESVSCNPEDPTDPQHRPYTGWQTCVHKYVLGKGEPSVVQIPEGTSVTMAAGPSYGNFGIAKWTEYVTKIVKHYWVDGHEDPDMKRTSYPIKLSVEETGWDTISGTAKLDLGPSDYMTGVIDWSSAGVDLLVRASSTVYDDIDSTISFHFEVGYFIVSSTQVKIESVDVDPPAFPGSFIRFEVGDLVTYGGKTYVCRSPWIRSNPGHGYPGYDDVRWKEFPSDKQNRIVAYFDMAGLSMSEIVQKAVSMSGERIEINRLFVDDTYVSFTFK